MKKTFSIQQLLTCLSISLILASCSSVGQISLTKSRYGNGIGLSLDKGISKEEQKRLEDKTAIIKERARQKRYAFNANSVSRGIEVKTKQLDVEATDDLNVVNVPTQSENAFMESSTSSVSAENVEVEKFAAPLNQMEAKKSSKVKKQLTRKSKKKGWGWLMDDMFILALIFAIIIPPIGVAIHEGITTRFWISLILTLIFFLPGMIYAILVVTETI